jgi:diacylglycerol O-acyltransferase / wax synthase
MSGRHESMSGVDTAWLHMDRPTNLMQIMGVMTFRRRLALAALRERVAARFLVHPRFRMRPIEGALGASWERMEPFDLRAHVRQRTLPSGGGDAALQRLLGRLAATPLDPARPRWEFLLIHVTPRRSAVVVRIHHCYADGIALVRVILGLGDDEPSAPQVDDAVRGPAADRADRTDDDAGWLSTATLERAWREASALAGQGLHLALHPSEAAAAAMTGVGIAAELAHLALLADEPPSALRGTLAGDKGIAWARPWPLAAVRAAAKALGCTINDLLVTAVAGALARWLRTRDAAPPRGLQVRAAVPVNLRPAGSEAALGNRFGLVFVELPVGACRTPERLARVHERMQALKASHQPLMTLGLLAALGLGPRRLQDGAVDLLSRKASLVMSNVPGPREPLPLLGVPVDAMMFWVPQSGDVGLGVSVLTYDGQVQFGVMADRGLVADPMALAAGFPLELRALARLGRAAS